MKSGTAQKSFKVLDFGEVNPKFSLHSIVNQTGQNNI